MSVDKAHRNHPPLALLQHLAHEANGQPFSGNYHPLPHPLANTAGHREALNRQLAHRNASEMPAECLHASFKSFRANSGNEFHPNWRWLYDPVAGPLVVSTPMAATQRNPARGVAVLLHGSGSSNSTPGSMTPTGNALVNAGYHVVFAPKPFHGGFGPTTESSYDLNAHMGWLRSVMHAATDYFPAPEGQESLPRVLIGRSTGGNEVLEYAVRHPQDAAFFFAMSPYHPHWGSDGVGSHRVFTAAGEYGLVTSNHAALAWNSAMDAQWTFLPKSFPAFPDEAPQHMLSVEAVDNLFHNAMAAAAGVPVDDRPLFLRNYLLNFARSRLPAPWREDKLLQGAAIAGGLESMLHSIPEAHSPLARLAANLVIYNAGTDSEYFAAHSAHALIWTAAIRSNPRIKQWLATRGEHDIYRQGASCGEQLQTMLLDHVNAACPPRHGRFVNQTPHGTRLFIAMAAQRHPAQRNTILDCCADKVRNDVEQLLGNDTLEHFVVGWNDKHQVPMPRNELRTITMGLWDLPHSIKRGNPTFERVIDYCIAQGIFVSDLPATGTIPALQLAQLIGRMNLQQVLECTMRINPGKISAIEDAELREWVLSTPQPATLAPFILDRHALFTS